MALMIYNFTIWVLIWYGMTTVVTGFLTKFGMRLVTLNHSTGINIAICTALFGRFLVLYATTILQ